MTGYGSEGHARSVGRVLRVLAIGALMAMAIAVSVPVGAAQLVAVFYVCRTWAKKPLASAGGRGEESLATLHDLC